MSDADKIVGFQPPTGNSTPRELLVRALNDVDKIDELIIIGKKRDEPEFSTGMAGVKTFHAIAMLEIFKARLLGQIERVPPVKRSEG